VTSPRSLGGALFARLSQIGARPTDDEETRSRSALLVLVSVMILPVSIVWGTLYLAFGSPIGVVPFAYFSVSLAGLLTFARTGNRTFLLRVEQLTVLLTTCLSMIPIGGFLTAGGVGLWGILAPLGALVFDSVRSAIRWFVAFLAIFLASGFLGEVLHPLPPVPALFTSIMLALNITVGGIVVFALLAVFAQQRHDALAALRAEEARSAALLENVLPHSIAERLKDQAQTIADSFGAASILFADVTNFTPLAGQLRPAELVGILDRLFGHFDTLVDRYELEKIKTIGDCYMAAAGIPTPRPDHARAVACLALDMLDAVRSNGAAGDLGLELRIGINSGPVVAGVIGRKRFLYDLWGDAVNTAGRMQTHSEPGRIQVTRATYELLKDEFVCEPRGSVEIKGKGPMDTWYVVGRKAVSA
jgi:adenylate cyclase